MGFLSGGSKVGTSSCFVEDISDHVVTSDSVTGSGTTESMISHAISLGSASSAGSSRREDRDAKSVLQDGSSSEFSAIFVTFDSHGEMISLLNGSLNVTDELQ